MSNVTSWSVLNSVTYNYYSYIRQMKVHYFQVFQCDSTSQVSPMQPTLHSSVIELMPTVCLLIREALDT